MRKVTRADLKAIRADLTADELTQILDLHHEVVAEFKDYVPKSDLDTVNAALKALQDAPPPVEKFSESDVSEYARLKQFETDTLTAKTTEIKTAALTKTLESAKANPKVLKLLLKEFGNLKDRNDIEVDYSETGEIIGVKNADKLIEPIKTSYSDFFGVEVISGATPGKATNIPVGKTDPFAAAIDNYKANITK